MTPWREWRKAAVAEARALRLLPPGCRVSPLDLGDVLSDATYLERRDRENERVRRYRAGQKEAS